MDDLENEAAFLKGELAESTALYQKVAAVKDELHENALKESNETIDRITELEEAAVEQKRVIEALRKELDDAAVKRDKDVRQLE